MLHTLPLTVIETLRTGHRWSTDPVVFGWYTAPGDSRPSDHWNRAAFGAMTGAVSMTPPFDLLLPEVPSGAMGELISALRVGVRPGAGRTGRTVAGGRLLRPMALRNAVVEAGGERQRLYRLDVLSRRPGSRAELAGRPWTTSTSSPHYWEEFQIEAGITRNDADALVRGRVEAGLVWLWERDGRVVSMAARNAIAAEVARVGPVYTPPAHRRRGYAAAVTSACSQDALDSGAGDVVLFTDLDNPTANSVYQSIGYRADQRLRNDPVRLNVGSGRTSSCGSCAPEPARPARRRPRPSRR